jgi:hypothetical protein
MVTTVDYYDIQVSMSFPVRPPGASREEAWNQSLLRRRLDVRDGPRWRPDPLWNLLTRSAPLELVDKEAEKVRFTRVIEALHTALRDDAAVIRLAVSAYP